MTENISSSSSSSSSPTFSSASASGDLWPSLAWHSSASNSPATVAHDGTTEPSSIGFGHRTGNDPFFNNKQAVAQALHAQEELFQGNGKNGWWHHQPVPNDLRRSIRHRQYHYRQQQQQQQQQPQQPYALQVPTQSSSFVTSTNVGGAFDAASTTTTARAGAAGGGSLHNLLQWLSLPEVQQLLHLAERRRLTEAASVKQQQGHLAGVGCIVSTGGGQQQQQQQQQQQGTILPLPPALPAFAMASSSSSSLPLWTGQRPPGKRQATMATNTPPAFTAAAGTAMSSTLQTTGVYQAAPAGLFPAGQLSQLSSAAEATAATAATAARATIPPPTGSSSGCH